MTISIFLIRAIKGLLFSFYTIFLGVLKQIAAFFLPPGIFTLILTVLKRDSSTPYVLINKDCLYRGEHPKADHIVTCILCLPRSSRIHVENVTTSRTSVHLEALQ